MSTSKPVVIRYRWDRNNVEKLFDALYEYQFNHSTRRYIGWLFIALLQFGVVAALKKGSAALLIFASVMLLYWYYGKKIIARRRALHSYEVSDLKDEMIHIEADEEGLVIESGESHTLWSWDEIEAVASLEDAVILYQTPHAHYIPASAFDSLESKSRFKSYAKRKGKLRQ